MSFRTKPTFAAIITGTLLGLSSPVLAAVQCPSQYQGHPLRLVDGGTIYLGDPADQMSQAPDGTRRGPNGSINTWTFRDASRMKLICRYDGTEAVVAQALPRDTLICRQEAKIRSFVCQ